MKQSDYDAKLQHFDPLARGLGQNPILSFKFINPNIHVRPENLFCYICRVQFHRWSSIFTHFSNNLTLVSLYFVKGHSI